MHAGTHSRRTARTPTPDPADASSPPKPAANEGAIAIWAGCEKTAKSRLTAAVALDPTNPVAVCEQGHFLECVQHDFSGAERMYEEAHRLAPFDATPLYARARLRHMRAHDAPGARELYAKALALEPANGIACLDSAHLELLAGNLADAKALALRSLSTDPHNPHALLLLSQTLLQMQSSTARRAAEARRSSMVEGLPGALCTGLGDSGKAGRVKANG